MILHNLFQDFTFPQLPCVTWSQTSYLRFTRRARLWSLVASWKDTCLQGYLNSLMKKIGSLKSWSVDVNLLLHRCLLLFAVELISNTKTAFWTPLLLWHAFIDQVSLHSASKHLTLLFKNLEEQCALLIVPSCPFTLDAHQCHQCQAKWKISSRPKITFIEHSFLKKTL